MAMPSEQILRRADELNDANRKLTIPIQADYAHHYKKPANAPVDAAIVAGRLLTGADFDIESFP